MEILYHILAAALGVLFGAGIAFLILACMAAIIKRLP